MLFKYTKEELQQRELLKQKFEELAKDATEEERSRLLLQLDADLAAHNEMCQKERFSKIADNPEKILQDAKKQIDGILQWEYNDLTVYSAPDPEELAMFEKAGVAIIENGKLFLTAQFAAEVLQEELKLHIDALKDDEKRLQKLFSIMVKQINNTDFVTGSITEGAENNAMAFFNSVPNGEVIHLLNRVMANSKKGYLLKASKRNRHEKIKTEHNQNKVRFIRENKDSTIIVELGEADKYITSNKANKAFEKILLFILQKMTAQNFPYEVGFALQDLVDLGMYQKTSNAKRALIDFFEQQKLITLSGTIKRGKETIREEGGVLFYHYRFPQRGYAVLSVNENFNMDFIAPYFTVFPKFAYALKSDAFSLVRLIFFLARQNTQKIKETGTFTISLETVRDNLGLPTVEKVKNRKYKQYIIDPIEAAIEEIETALQGIPEASDYGFTITLYGTETNKINEWLQGYIEIGLSGHFAKTFIQIATKTEQDKQKWELAKLTQAARIAALTDAKEGENPGK